MDSKTPNQNKTLKALLLVTIVSLFSCLSDKPELKDLGQPGDFELIDHNGETFSSESLRGQPYLMFFGFTNCPDYCPNTMAKIRNAYNQLPDSMEKPLILFISVDPERDRPERLKNYLSHFTEHALGLTGTVEQVADVAEMYGAHYEISSAETEVGYLVDHSTYIYLMDEEGTLRYLFRHADTATWLAEGIKQL